METGLPALFSPLPALFRLGPVAHRKPQAAVSQQPFSSALLSRSPSPKTLDSQSADQIRFLILIRLARRPALDFLCDLEQAFGPFFASVSPCINDHVGLSPLQAPITHAENKDRGSTLGIQRKSVCIKYKPVGIKYKISQWNWVVVT